MECWITPWYGIGTDAQLYQREGGLEWVHARAVVDQMVAWNRDKFKSSMEWRINKGREGWSKYRSNGGMEWRLEWYRMNTYIYTHTHTTRARARRTPAATLAGSPLRTASVTMGTSTWSCQCSTLGSSGPPLLFCRTSVR